jgi:hypothetical protein
LEVLLHEALEGDTENGFNLLIFDSSLPKILEFVKLFPRSLEIIVNCARKSEMSYWNRFFRLAGDPKDLYHTALQSGEFNIATSYLIIIQTLEPLQVSCQVILL